MSDDMQRFYVPSTLVGYRSPGIGPVVVIPEADALAAVEAAEMAGLLTLHRAEEAWREEVRVRSLEQYEQGVKDGQRKERQAQIDHEKAIILRIDKGDIDD